MTVLVRVVLARFKIVSITDIYSIIKRVNKTIE